MKKILLLILIFIIFLFSCHREYGILSYQQNDVEAICTVNEKYTVKIVKSDDLKRMEVLFPDTLEGVFFEMQGENIYVIKEETKIPMSRDSLKGICALLNCFSLKEDFIINLSEEGVASFDTENGIYTVTYGKNSLPQHIKISGDNYEYSVLIDTVKIKQRNT